VTPPFSFEGIIVLSFFSALLLAGVFLRAFLPLLQRMLFPASLIGGTIGLIAANAGLIPIDAETVKAFAYHLFNISFISVGLTAPEFAKGSGGAPVIVRGAAWMALVQAVTFTLQALLGAAFVLLFLWLGFPLFKTFGFLLPLAFNEGPGQALSIGRAWEAVGFAEASTIGLTFAAMGFFFAFFVGVPLANLGLRKKKFSVRGPDAFFLRGILPKGEKAPSAGGLTTHGANLDGLAFHLALVGLSYLLTYFLMLAMTRLAPSEAGSILWGFFFLFGLVVAILLRRTFFLTPLSHLMNPDLQRRITGFSIDYLIVATGCGIELLVVWEYITPILLMGLSAGIFTTMAIILLSRGLFAYRLERSIAIYGVVTGTVSCGLLLLRIVDPELKSPAAREIGFMNVFAVPVVGGLTFFINVPLWWGWGLLSTSLVLLAVCALSSIIVSSRRIWGEKQGTGADHTPDTPHHGR
jgi:ESS family glutamate:Na+ symporter